VHAKNVRKFPGEKVECQQSAENGNYEVIGSHWCFMNYWKWDQSLWKMVQN